MTRSPADPLPDRTPVPRTETAITTTSSPEQQAEAEQPADAAPPAWRQRLDRWLQPTTLLVVLAALPPLLMARRIHQDTQLNYQDYWVSMLRIAHPDGGLHLRGLFTYQNEHPFVIPQIFFYADARLLSGTNHELGFLTLLLGVASLVVLWLLLPNRWNPLIRGLMLLVSSLVLFCPAGAWNFVRGMSGNSWITANLFALVAILFASRRRTVLALVAAALSLLSYGTGFGAPVAIIVIALLRRDRRWRWLLPLGMLLGAAVLYKATVPQGTSGPHGHDPGLLLQTMLSNIGQLWDPTAGSTGVLLGAAGLAVAVACGLRYHSGRLNDQYADLVPWWGVLVYSLIASMLISLARSQAFAGDGAQSRYVSLSALFWISLAVLALRLSTTPRELVLRGIAIGVAVLVFWGVSPTLFNVAISQSPRQDEIAAGLRFGAVDPFGANVFQPRQQIPRLKAMHDYPFNDSYTVGCGVKPDASIDMAKVRTLPKNLFPQFGALDSDTVTGDARQLRGWLFRPFNPTKCAFLVDSTGKVVGGGSAAMPRSDVAALNPSFGATAGFELVTPASQADAIPIFGFSDGFYRLPASANPAAPGTPK